MAAAAAATAVVVSAVPAAPDHFSREETRFKLGKQLAEVSAAPDSAAAALAATAVSLFIDSSAEKIEEWYLEDESDLAEVILFSRMMLLEVHRFVIGPTCNQMAIDALSLELPSPIAKLGALCLDFNAAKSIIETFAYRCTPRDNLLILCEALDTHGSVPVAKTSSYFIILLDGIGKVLPLIQRQRAHNIKMAMRAVTGSVRYASSVLDEHNGRNATDLFNEAFRFSNIVQEMCKTMADEEKEEVNTVLGLYALQNIAFISQSKQEHSLSCAPLAIGYSQLAIASGFSWKRLLIGDSIRSAVEKFNEGFAMSRFDWFSLAMEGAHLSACWMNKHHGKGQLSMLEMLSALKEVNLAYTDKWSALQMFMYVLPSRNYQWDVKSYSLELLSHFHERGNGDASQHECLLSVSVSIRMVKEIESMRISAPDESVRIKAYGGIKKIIRMLPQGERVTVLHELIKDRTCPISTWYLLDLVKDDISTECNLYNELEDYEALSPCHKDCLDFLSLNLGHPYGGNLDYWEKVLDCLSLLRYLLIRGSRTLSKPAVRKVILEWLAPLEFHIETKPEDKDCGVQADIALETVKYCMALTDKWGL